MKKGRRGKGEGEGLHRRAPPSGSVVIVAVAVHACDVFLFFQQSLRTKGAHMAGLLSRPLRDISRTPGHSF